MVGLNVVNYVLHSMKMEQGETLSLQKSIPMVRNSHTCEE